MFRIFFQNCHATTITRVKTMRTRFRGKMVFGLYTVKYGTRPYSRFVCISLTVDFLRRVRLPIPPSSTLPSCPWSRTHPSRFPPTFCFIAMQFQHSYTSSTKIGIVLTHALLVLSATDVRAKKTFCQESNSRQVREVSPERSVL